MDKQALILIVDDSEANAELLSTVLSSRDYKTQTVFTGAEALTTIESELPDLILLDINMPGLNGYQVCQQLKAQPKTDSIPVIFISALGDTLDKVKAFEVGGVDYITRPFQLEEVLVRVENQLTLRRLQQELQTANEILEERVAERTETLSKTVTALEEQIVERKQAETALQEYAERLRILHQIDQAILAAHSTEAIAQAALEHIKQLIPCRRVSLTLFEVEDGGESARILGVFGDATLQVDNRLPLLTFGNIDELAQGLPHITDRRFTEAEAIKGRPLFEDAGALLNVPLMTKAGLIGALNLGGDNIFHSEHLAIAREVAIQLAVAIVQARLFEAEAQRRQEAEALQDIAAALNSTLDLEKVLERILNNVGRVVPHDAANIMLIERGIARIVSTQEPAKYTVGESLLKRPFVVADIPTFRQVVESKEAVVIPDTQTSDDWINIPETHWMRSYIGMPISNGDKVLGFINLVSATPHFFTTARAERLKAFADQAAVGLGNARLHAASQRRSREMAALYKATRLMASSLHLSEVLEQAMTEIRALLEAESASVMLYDPVTHELTFKAAATEAAASLLGRRFPADQGIAGWVMGKKLPVITDDAQNHPHFYDQIDAITGQVTRSLVAVPLIFHNMVLGVIEVVNKSDGAFDHGDLELLQALASSAAIAIKNAHLYEDVQEQYEVLKSTQAQLIHSEKMAALGRLAASLAHEINNPLQSVQTCITLTKEELEQVDQTKALDRYLNIVENEIDRISTIVHRMRDFYRPSSSGMQAVQLHQVLDSVLALTDKQLQQSNITVETRWADDLPDVTANPDHLRQIFLNLILNAIDAMPRGGLLQITTAVDTLICATDEGQAPGVRVDFSDTGEGIPAQIQTRIFEPFFTTKSGGSGLGLSTSYGIIEAHQGQITVSSEPGRETTFSIILPLEQVANRPDNPEKET